MPVERGRLRNKGLRSGINASGKPCDQELQLECVCDLNLTLIGEALDIDNPVRDAADGYKSAWERHGARYSRSIWAMTRDFKLAESDAADVVRSPERLRLMLQAT